MDAVLLCDVDAADEDDEVCSGGRIRCDWGGDEATLDALLAEGVVDDDDAEEYVVDVEEEAALRGSGLDGREEDPEEWTEGALW